MEELKELQELREAFDKFNKAVEKRIECYDKILDYCDICETVLDDCYRVCNNELVKNEEE